MILFLLQVKASLILYLHKKEFQAHFTIPSVDKNSKKNQKKFS